MNDGFEKNQAEQNDEKIEEHYNSRLINMLNEYLLDQSKILELGSGTGADLVQLSKHYQVTGSDISPSIVKNIKETYPDIDMILLDVRKMDIKGKYDCIYSNKVLSHLTKEELESSLNKQVEHLNDDGMILMTLSYGEYREKRIEKDGLLYTYYNEMEISNLVPKSLRIDLIDSYSEDEREDSLMVILKKRTD